MPAPLETDPQNFEPRLSARREYPPGVALSAGLRAAGRSRAVVFHFATAGRSPAVRRTESTTLHKRKVVVLSRKILSPITARKALTAHVRYLTREGVEPDGQPARFFDQGADDADPKAFLARCTEEPGHYRLMLNPEDGAELPDLRAFARQYMQAVSRDVGKGLEWLASGHHDTGRPHLHILLRDRSLEGGRLKLTLKYLHAGLRQTAEDVATELLGPRVDRASTRTIRADRFTEIDRLITGAAFDGRIEASMIPEPYRPDALRRLIHLEKRGLVRALGPAAWALPPDLHSNLRQINQTNARALAAARVMRDSQAYGQASRLELATLAPGDRVVGAYVGLRPTMPYPAGSQTLVIDATDGRLAHVTVQYRRTVLCLDQIPEGAVIEVAGHERARRVDQTISDIASERDGVWSPADHAAARPDDWPSFIKVHKMRAEAMSSHGACTALGEGHFRVPADYCSLAAKADCSLWGPSDLVVRVLDDKGLEEQIRSPGFTWLDRLMTSAERPGLSGPFGEAVTTALGERAKRLRMTGLGAGEPLVLSEGDVMKLRTMEVRAVLEEIEKSGKPVFVTAEGQSAAGVYVKRVHVSGRPYAVLEGSSSSHLVLWTAGMEKYRGRALTAALQNHTVTFRAARGLGLDLGL